MNTNNNNKGLVSIIETNGIVYAKKFYFIDKYFVIKHQLHYIQYNITPVNWTNLIYSGYQ